MQRLREIEQRRRELHDELQLLDLEEQQIRKAMASTAAIDPAYIALVQQSNTQHGCAEAQSRFDAATREERSAMFTAAMSEVRALATQTYGALFLQKLLEAGSQEHLLQFLDTLRVGSTLVDVAITTPGSRIIQRFMELLRGSEGLTQLVEMISARIVPLSNDVNACHVVQRVLTNRVAGEKMPLVQALINNIVAVATNKQGCCILQRAMDWLPDPMRGRVVDAVLHYELDLVQDAFGNYVVQHLLDRKDDALIKRTIQPLLHNIAGLACNKFGSNVIEKCVRVAHPNIKQLLMDELTDPSVLPRLLQDSYANYVIQTAISSSSEEQFQQLHAAIRPSFASLKNSPYGVRIEAKIQRRLKDNARARQRQTKKKHEADIRANHQIRPLPMGVPGTLAVSTASPAEFALSASPVAPPSPLARMPYNAVPRQP